MTFAKTLLSSVAICALCTAPALAREAPRIHLAGIETATKMSAPHFKSGGGSPDISNFTETTTFTGTLSEANYHKMPVMLWGETWYSSTTCLEPTREAWAGPKTTAAARLKAGTSTGTIAACGSTVFTFHGPIYTLEARHVTSDSFASTVKARRFEGYNLTLNANTDLTITP